MTDQEINVAIAEACGWTEQGEMRIIPLMEVWFQGRHRRVPFFCSDLNAMHEVENTLSAQDRNAYIDILGEAFCQSWAFCTATARQRAEAFMRTIGKWVAE